MSLHIEQECPQCGGPVELVDTDHLINCPFCGVNSFLANSKTLHLTLPSSNAEATTYYAPYLHFKGSIFICNGMRIDSRLADHSHRAVDLVDIPYSLGVRPQAMKMQFVSEKVNGKYLKPSIPFDDILTSVARSGEKFRAFIGEAKSYIYLPLKICGNELMDGMLDRPFSKLSDDDTILNAPISNGPVWQPHFMPTLCPKCGWNLEGERDSVVLFCRNCVTAWETANKEFCQIDFELLEKNDSDLLFLPFWKIQASTISGVSLESFADFIEITNQPIVVQRSWQSTPMNFMCPAFKIRPQDYLKISTHLTLKQQKDLPTTVSLQHEDIFPVTLPKSEAFQSLQFILANSTLNKTNVFPVLADITFSISKTKLVYLPFNIGRTELIQKHLEVLINRQALEFGRCW